MAAVAVMVAQWPQGHKIEQGVPEHTPSVPCAGAYKDVEVVAWFGPPKPLGVGGYQMGMALATPHVFILWWRAPRGWDTVVGGGVGSGHYR